MSVPTFCHGLRAISDAVIGSDGLRRSTSLFLVHERSHTCIASNAFENVECVAIVCLSSSLNKVARQVACGPSPRETTSRRGSRWTALTTTLSLTPPSQSASIVARSASSLSRRAPPGATYRWSSVVGQRQVHRMTRQLTPSSLGWGHTTPAQVSCSAHPSPGKIHVVGSVPTSTDSSSAADPSVAESLSTGLE